MRLLRSILLGLWRGLDGLRKFLHLLLLLIFFGFLVGLVHVSVPSVPAKAALLIEPEGRLVEQLSGDPLARAVEDARGQGRPETLLWELTDSIRAAAKDRRIPCWPSTSRSSTGEVSLPSRSWRSPSVSSAPPARR